MLAYLTPPDLATVGPSIGENAMVDTVGVVEPVKKIMGIADKKYSNIKSIEDEEKELEELIKQQEDDVKTEEKQAAEEVEPENPEEKTFKKRYGDLRRHSQQQQNELKEKLSALEQQLDVATKNQIQLPKSEEEIDSWSQEYPDVAAIIETIAIKKSKEQAQELETRIEEIDNLQASAKRERAEVELLSLHPDFDDIRSSNNFHEWVEEQPKWVQDALYENETDARSAARAIDLYKIDTGIGKEEKESTSNSEKSAATLVETNSPKNIPDIEDNTNAWKESDVEAMSADEYEEHSDAIMESLKAGTFIYDLSGNAR
jgi:DNA repair exonuclease SbcCD ATPase subunit